MGNKDKPEIPKDFTFTDKERDFVLEFMKRRLRLTNMVKEEGIVEAAVDCHESYTALGWVYQIAIISWSVFLTSVIALVALLTSPPDDQLLVGVLGNLITGFLASGLLASFIALLEGGVKRKVYRERIKLFAIRFHEDFLEWYKEYYNLMEGNSKVYAYLKERGYILEDEDLATVVKKQGVPVLKIDYEEVQEP